ncbi:MAG: 4-hydroxy-tetrahydrodipicolinate reductase [Deltaproteobacteria bacterium]|nr:4-hydroxy-tetrahydrodipicolinate reductase [Deltaproteobacteria bacterium]
MTTQPKLWVHGLTGRMGASIRQELGAFHFSLVGGSGLESGLSELSSGLSESDCIIDVTSPIGHDTLIEAFEGGELTKKRVLICTTGLSKQQLGHWKQTAKPRGLTVLAAPNTSLGILLMLKSALAVAGLSLANGFDIEMEETHHRGKADAPSGTAIFLARNLCKTNPKLKVTSQRKGAREKNEIGISATRGGGVFGEHRIRFLGDHEELAITHRAFSRSLFARGALLLTEWLVKQQPGFHKLEEVSLN